MTGSLFIALYLLLAQVDNTISSALSCGNGTSSALRLVGLSSSVAGGVEMCINNTWRALVVDENDGMWTMQNSVVACRSLGHESVAEIGLNYYHRERSVRLLSDAEFVVSASSLKCTGRENSLSECSTGTNPTRINSSLPLRWTDYRNDKNVYQPVVFCKDPVHGDVRLTGSSDQSKGIVEVYDSYYGWSTVCTDSWDDSDARVVCQSLGYATGQKETTRYAFLGLPTRRYNSFKCSGHETSILDCEYTGPYPGGCRSAFPARISCQINSSVHYSLGISVLVLTAALFAVTMIFLMVLVVMICRKNRRRLAVMRNSRETESNEILKN